MKRFKVKSVVEEVQIQYIPNFALGDTPTYKKLPIKEMNPIPLNIKIVGQKILHWLGFQLITQTLLRPTTL